MGEDYKTLDMLDSLDRADDRSVKGAKNLKGMDISKMSTEDVLNAYLGKKPENKQDSQ